MQVEDDNWEQVQWDEVRDAIAEAARETARGVRATREDRFGWSQEELAARMRRLGFNWHQTTVGKVEAGTRPLKWDEALGLAFVLHHSRVDSLLNDHLRVGVRHLRLEGMLIGHWLSFSREVFRNHGGPLGIDWLETYTNLATQTELEYGVKILPEGERS